MFMNKTNTLIATAAVVVIGIGTASAASIYSESFDYGSSDLPFNGGNVGTWTSNSGVLKYDADGGLASSQLTGETGGSMWLDYTAARTGNDSSLNYAMSSMGIGNTVWVAALFQYVTGTGTDHILTIGGGVISSLGIAITSGGNVVVSAADPSNTNGAVGSNSTGITNVANGTYLVLLRATVGSNSYNNTGSPDSTVDFWFDPSDVTNLGTPDWTSTGGSKFGRSTDTFSSVSATPSEQGRTDEIRIANSLAELGANIPEPASLALFALGGLMVLSRRRK
ncbi:MAG: PEP-CTERM sorting domain-containing protein [Phycisphaera sp.]|nr:PEP-CTERM sorting domain-containing protein [Phycisphaera sp.]